eukprot:2218824-Rhodomonas_salina.2
MLPVKIVGGCYVGKAVALAFSFSGDLGQGYPTRPLLNFKTGAPGVCGGQGAEPSSDDSGLAKGGLARVGGVSADRMQRHRLQPDGGGTAGSTRDHPAYTQLATGADISCAGPRLSLWCAEEAMSRSARSQWASTRSADHARTDRECAVKERRQRLLAAVCPEPSRAVTGTQDGHLVVWADKTMIR